MGLTRYIRENYYWNSNYEAFIPEEPMQFQNFYKGYVFSWGEFKKRAKKHLLTKN